MEISKENLPMLQRKISALGGKCDLPSEGKEYDGRISLRRDDGKWDSYGLRKVGAGRWCIKYDGTFEWGTEITTQPTTEEKLCDIIHDCIESQK